MRKQLKTFAILGISAVLTAVPVMTAHAWVGVGARLAQLSQRENRSENEEISFDFRSGTTTIVMGADAAPILEALGEPEKVFEQDSCAYQGKDRVYTYDGFELSTYPVGDMECVSSVYFLDDSVETANGIRIGSTEDEVKHIYEGHYTVEFGVYRMNDGQTELLVYTTGGVVDAVEYLVVTD